MWIVHELSHHCNPIQVKGWPTAVCLAAIPVVMHRCAAEACLHCASPGLMKFASLLCSFLSLTTHKHALCSEFIWWPVYFPFISLVMSSMTRQNCAAGQTGYPYQQLITPGHKDIKGASEPRLPVTGITLLCGPEKMLTVGCPPLSLYWAGWHICLHHRYAAVI